MPSIDHAKRIGWAAALLLLLGGVAAACNKPAAEDPSAAKTESTAASYAPGDSVSVTGLLIDTRCFALDKENSTNDHTRPEGRVSECAAACARLGFPVAILEGGTPDGYVWVLSFPPQVFADFMANTVRVRGEFRSEGILIPHRVEMQTSDGWTTIM